MDRGNGTSKDGRRRTETGRTSGKGRIPADPALRAMWREALNDALEQADAELARAVEALGSARRWGGIRGGNPWDSADYDVDAIECAAATVGRLLSYEDDDRLMGAVAASIAERGYAVDRRSLASALHACAELHAVHDESAAAVAYRQGAMRAARESVPHAARSDPWSFRARQAVGRRAA